MSPPVALPTDLLAMMDRGVSVIVGSRAAANRPSLMRAMGSAVADGGRSITVYVSRQQSRQLLEDVASSGHRAVVFSEPLSHRTVQLKTRQVSIRPATALDVPLLARYLKSMEHELGQVGIPPSMTRAMLAHQLDDVVALGFVPELAFDQTPGPRAGEALAGRPA